MVTDRIKKCMYPATGEVLPNRFFGLFICVLQCKKGLLTMEKIEVKPLPIKQLIQQRNYKPH